MSKYLFTQEDIEAWDCCFAKQQNILSIYNRHGENNQEFIKSYLHDFLVDTLRKNEDNNYTEYFNFLNHLVKTEFPFVLEMHNYLAELKRENYLYYPEILYLYTNCLKENNVTISEEHLKELYPTINTIRIPSDEVIQSCVNLVSLSNCDKNTLLLVTLNKLLEKTESGFSYDSQKVIYSYFKDFKQEQDLEKYIHYYPAFKDDKWTVEEDFFEKSIIIDVNKILNYYNLNNNDLEKVNNVIIHLFSNFVDQDFLNEEIPNVTLVHHACKILEKVNINVRFSTLSQEQGEIINKKFHLILVGVLDNFLELTKGDNLDNVLTTNYLRKICFNEHLKNVVPQSKNTKGKKKI